MTGLWQRIVIASFIICTLFVSLAYGAGRLVPSASLYFLSAHTEGNRLYAADTNRGNLSVRASYLPDYAPFTLSPDRQYAAFTHVASIQIQIVIVDLIEDRIHQVIDNVGNRIGPLSWSPDGHSLAYTSNQRGTNDLYTINLQTGERHWLADNVAVDALTWSPDSQQIAYVSSLAAPYAICAVSVNEPVPRCLPRRGARNGTTSPSWSPDGREIAFSADFDRNPEIYVIPVDCLVAPLNCEQLERRLTSSPTIDVAPLWSPDGQYIAYVSNQGGVRGVFVMNKDGSHVRRVSPDIPGGYWANWSPDSRSLAYMVGAFEKPQIYVVDVQTGHYRQLTNTAFAYLSPVWSPR